MPSEGSQDPIWRLSSSVEVPVTPHGICPDIKKCEDDFNGCRSSRLFEELSDELIQDFCLKTMMYGPSFASCLGWRCLR